MVKLLVLIMVIGSVSIFAMDNMHQVDVGLIIGRAVRVRLFFLLLCVFLAGCILTMFLSIYLGLKTKKAQQISHEVSASGGANEDHFPIQEEV